MKGRIETMAADSEHTGEWLSAAMEQSWAVAGALVEFDDLADLLGERHRIIGNDWQAAGMAPSPAASSSGLWIWLPKSTSPPGPCARTSPARAEIPPISILPASCSTAPPTCTRGHPRWSMRTSDGGASSTGGSET